MSCTSTRRIISEADGQTSNCCIQESRTSCVGCCTILGKFVRQESLYDFVIYRMSLHVESNIISTYFLSHRERVTKRFLIDGVSSRIRCCEMLLSAYVLGLLIIHGYGMERFLVDGLFVQKKLLTISWSACFPNALYSLVYELRILFRSFSSCTSNSSVVFSYPFVEVRRHSVSFRCYCLFLLFFISYPRFCFLAIVVTINCQPEPSIGHNIVIFSNH